MVAYSFQTRFLPEIRALRKQQTIRLPRKRHARPGEALQFFTGPRMKPVRVGSATCVAVHEVRLDFENNLVELDDAVVLGAGELDAFAIRDGFRPPERLLHTSAWAYMARWWRVTHPTETIFRGVLIDWAETFEAAL